MDLSDFFAGSMTPVSVLSTFITLTVFVVALTSLAGMFFGVFQIVRWRTDRNKANRARKKIIYSITGLTAAFLVWFIINLVSAFFGISIGAEPTYIPLWKCSPAALKLIFQNKLSYIHSCDVIETEVDGVKGKLVYIEHGPAVGCSDLFCSYNDLNAVIVNKKVTNVTQEPEIYNLLKYKYGRWCDISTEPNQPGLKKTFSTVGNKLVWNFDFDDYSNERLVIEKLVKDRNLATNENSQSCVFNGRMQILSQGGKEGTSADFSNLKVEMKKITSVTPYPLEEVVNYCSKRGTDLCYESLGIARSEFKYCQLIKTKYNKDRCIEQVARDFAQREACNNISDDEFKNICDQLVEQRLKTLN